MRGLKHSANQIHEGEFCPVQEVLGVDGYLIEGANRRGPFHYPSAEFSLVSSSFCLDMNAEEAQSLGKTKRECKALACAIQRCLTRRDYDEKRCLKEIADWHECDRRLKTLQASLKKDSSISKDDTGKT